MPRYRVTLRRSSVEIVEASNQYQAAIVARDLFGDSVEVADVQSRRRAARRRPRSRSVREADEEGREEAPAAVARGRTPSSRRTW